MVIEKKSKLDFFNVFAVSFESPISSTMKRNDYDGNINNSYQ